MNVRVIIEKDGDYDYVHFNSMIPSELIPKVGEVIELWYPDGYCLQKKKVINVRKKFERDELVIMVIVNNGDIKDYTLDF